MYDPTRVLTFAAMSLLVALGVHTIFGPQVLNASGSMLHLGYGISVLTVIAFAFFLGRGIGLAVVGQGAGRGAEAESGTEDSSE